jgi:hypothetical protein
MPYMKIFRITSLTLLGMVLLVALTACGGGTEPLAAGNGSPALFCLGQGGNTGCGGGSGGGVTTGGNGNGTTTQVLSIDNAAFVSSITARTVDAMVAVGTLLQVMLPALTTNATVPTCAGGSLPVILPPAVTFSNCTLPGMTYAVNGKLTWADVGNVNFGLSGTGGNHPNFELIDHNTIVTELSTAPDAVTAGVQLGTNPITLQLNTQSNITPAIDIIPGGGDTAYTLTNSAGAVVGIQLTTALDGSPLTLNNMTGTILHIPRTEDEVSIAVATLPWNGASPGNGTLTVTDGTSTITLNVDSAGSNVGISMTTNGTFSGQCETLKWIDLVTGGDTVTTAACS